MQLEGDLALPGGGRQTQSLEHVMPPSTASLLALHVPQQPLALVAQLTQTALVVLISVAAPALERLGERPDLGRQDGDLHLTAARVRTCPHRLRLGLHSGGQRRRRPLKDVICGVATESLDAAADVGVFAILGTTMLQLRDTLEGGDGLGVSGGVLARLLVLLIRVGRRPVLGLNGLQDVFSVLDGAVELVLVEQKVP